MASDTATEDSHRGGRTRRGRGHERTAARLARGACGKWQRCPLQGQVGSQGHWPQTPASPTLPSALASRTPSGPLVTMTTTAQAADPGLFPKRQEVGLCCSAPGDPIYHSNSHPRGGTGGLRARGAASQIHTAKGHVDPGSGHLGRRCCLHPFVLPPSPSSRHPSE